MRRHPIEFKPLEGLKRKKAPMNEAAENLYSKGLTQASKVQMSFDIINYFHQPNAQTAQI